MLRELLPGCFQSFSSDLKKMFSMKPMAKARVTVASSKVDELVRELFAFGMIQVKKSKQLADGRPLSTFQAISSALIRLRGAEKEFSLKSVWLKALPTGEENLSELLSDYAALNLDSLEEWRKKITELESSSSAVRDKIAELDAFKEVNFALPKTDLIEIYCIQLADARKPLQIKNASTHIFGDKALVALDKRFRDKALAELKKYALRFIPVPSVESSFADAHAKAVSELESINAEKKELSSKILDFVAKNHEKIVFLKKAFALQARKSELPLLFGSSESLCVVEGWVFDSDFDRLKTHVENSFNHRVLIEKLHTSDVAPSDYENPTLAKPFESFMSFLSVPRVDEIDPTIIVALTFPLFFGMILGDIGYGLILMLLGLLIRVKAKDRFVSNAGGMMLYSGIFTVIFGFIFGEFFGFEEIFGLKLEPFIHRVDPLGVQALLALSVLFGFIHLALGFILAIANNVSHKHYKHALAKAGWLVLSISLVFLVSLSINLVFFSFIKQIALVFGPQAALYGTLLGLGVLVYTEGIIALFEIPGYISNLLSYMRIAALGITGVILAGLVNQLKPDLSLVASLNPVAIVMFVLTLAFFVVGHAISLGLGIFESGIQALRLHAVEFFSKFYKGGAELFTPLKRKG